MNIPMKMRNIIQDTLNNTKLVMTEHDWSCLSSNPSAIFILEKNLDKVDWMWLSKNLNAIHILENNIDKIKWKELSSNPNAIHLLEKNIDKIH